MNEDDIKRSIASAMEWSAQEQAAYMNASNWLAQAARGEVPHGHAAFVPLTGYYTEDDIPAHLRDMKPCVRNTLPIQDNQMDHANLSPDVVTLIGGGDE